MKFQFKPNNSYIRQKIKEFLEEYLYESHQYDIICDETNNPPDSVVNGTLNVDVVPLCKFTIRPGVKFDAMDLSNES